MSTGGGVAVDKNGTVIISEKYILNKYRGNAIYQTSTTLSTATFDTSIFNSCSIAINPSGNVFFCDTQNSRIMVFV
jgi:sugar lactone lactonase YvrE